MPARWGWWSAQRLNFRQTTVVRLRYEASVMGRWNDAYSSDNWDVRSSYCYCAVRGRFVPSFPRRVSHCNPKSGQSSPNRQCLRPSYFSAGRVDGAYHHRLCGGCVTSFMETHIAPLSWPPLMGMATVGVVLFATWILFWNFWNSVNYIYFHDWHLKPPPPVAGLDSDSNPALSLSLSQCSVGCGFITLNGGETEGFGLRNIFRSTSSAYNLSIVTCLQRLLLAYFLQTLVALLRKHSPP